MAISDKLQELLDIKQDIKEAIETKGVPMTDVAFTEYANKILDISGGSFYGELDAGEFGETFTSELDAGEFV